LIAFKAIVGILLVSFFFALPTPVLSITCEECKAIERNISFTDKELRQTESELSEAFSKRDYSRVTQLQAQINSLSKKLLDLKNQQTSCKDACRPDVVKQAECKSILAEIAVLDADAATSAANQEKVDAKYKELLDCNKELEQLKKQNKP